MLRCLLESRKRREEKNNERNVATEHSRNAGESRKLDINNATIIRSEFLLDQLLDQTTTNLTEQGLTDIQVNPLKLATRKLQSKSK